MATKRQRRLSVLLKNNRLFIGSTKPQTEMNFARTSAALFVPFNSHFASPAALSLLSIFSTATSFCSLELIFAVFCFGVWRRFCCVLTTINNALLFFHTPLLTTTTRLVLNTRLTDRHKRCVFVQKRRWRRSNRTGALRADLPASVCR